MPPITEGAIKAATNSAGMVAAGYQYYRQGRVRIQEIDALEGMVIAWVQGTGRKPYETLLISLGEEEGLGPGYYTTCTCPVRGGCKHGAAVMYALMDGGLDSPNTSAPTQPVRPRLRLEAVDRTAVGVSGDLAMWHAEHQADAMMRSREHVALRFVLGLQKLPKSPTQSRKRHAPQLPSLPQAATIKAFKWGQDNYSRLEKWAAVWATELLGGHGGDFAKVERRLLAQMNRAEQGGVFGANGLPQGEEGWDWLERAAHAGLLKWKAPDGPSLVIGAPRQAAFAWSHLPDGRHALALHDQHADVRVIAMDPPVLVDVASLEICRLDSALPGDRFKHLLQLPPLTAFDALALAGDWQASFGEVIAAPPAPAFRNLGLLQPIPVLTFMLEGYLDSAAFRGGYGGRAQTHLKELMAARLAFDYPGQRVSAPARERQIQLHSADEIVVFERDLVAEQAAVDRLLQTSLVPVAELGLYPMQSYQGWDHMLLPEFSERSYFDVLGAEVQALSADGWRVEYSTDWPLQYVDVDADRSALSATVRHDAGSGIDWFDIALEAEVEGQRIDILPALRQMLAGGGRELLQLGDGEEVVVELGSGRFTRLPLGKIRPLLEAILALALDEREAGTLSSPRHDVGLLEGLENVGFGCLGAEALRCFARTLREVAPGKVVVPGALQAQLRAYQEVGLGWLQALWSAGFGGILADDMGLGKTVQTIAHVLACKEECQAPVLIVCPTSVLPNWQAELERFAPHLAVLAWHGPNRAEQAGALESCDIVLTTYPLLVRDKAVFEDRSVGIAVFDEAHVLKNPTTAGFLAARKIKAQQVIALSGTPIENRLNDLWALATLTNPGMLGSFEHFRTTYRKPIENDGDARARQTLARKMRPFLLRRSKDEVASDLPPKTIISEWVDLEGEQMRLYESQRLLMQQKVRDEIARVGLMRSHIIVLDAMLKLRQICCDPALLKAHRDEVARKKGAGAAGKSKSAPHPSAKRSRALEMIAELLAEGRRILFFSQFTTMLDLLKADLAEAGIAYEEIRGSTKDRAGPVARFQGGDVSLMLVSLKAGGTGLNLTAADTVILYDPWWNPAVEAQAIDRAHRIGQQKPVFVYRLIARRTIEEKILLLQDQKRELAEFLWREGEGGAEAFTGAQSVLTDEDIAFLLAKD